MERILTKPRVGWQSIVAGQGLEWHTVTNDLGQPERYWNESAYYAFTGKEISAIERATGDLFQWDHPSQYVESDYDAADAVILRFRSSQLRALRIARPELRELLVPIESALMAMIRRMNGVDRPLTDVARQLADAHAAAALLRETPTASEPPAAPTFEEVLAGYSPERQAEIRQTLGEQRDAMRESLRAEHARQIAYCEEDCGVRRAFEANRSPVSEDTKRLTALVAIPAAFDEWYHHGRDCLMDTKAGAFRRLQDAIDAARSLSPTQDLLSESPGSGSLEVPE